jgi:hypothetical protein
MGAFLQYVVREWRAISRAPLTFFTALLVTGGIIFLITNWYFLGRIDDLNERINLRDDQISNLNHKFGTTSLDAIDKRFRDLEEQLQALRAPLPNPKPALIPLSLYRPEMFSPEDSITTLFYTEDFGSSYLEVNTLGTTRADETGDWSFIFGNGSLVQCPDQNLRNVSLGHPTRSCPP